MASATWTSNDFLLRQSLEFSRSLNISNRIHDRLLLNLYSSLELQGANQLATNHHKAAIFDLDIEDGENRYLLCSGQVVLSPFATITSLL